MDFDSWIPERPDQTVAREEMLVCFNANRAARILVVPALFDEANKLRRFTLGVMRTLDEEGVDSLLPDLPGCNESLAPLSQQTLAGWRADLAKLAERFKATHVLSIRAGAMMAPKDLPGWRYAPLEGSKILSGLLRGRVLAARELGREESREGLLELGREEGLELAGWKFSAPMIRELESASPAPSDQRQIEQSELGGAGLWLRAEPDDDPKQAAALARIIVQDLQAEPEASA